MICISALFRKKDMNDKKSSGDPLISVIVPVYKVEEYLDACVESICGQSWQNLEIILVDDGSPDECPALCDRWGQKDKRIRVIHKENGGLSDARNAGMKIAHGDYIGFVDSDDWISPRMYELLLAAMDRDQSEISCCTAELFREDPEQVKYLSSPVNVVLDREEAQRALLRESLLKQPVWYKLYKRDLIKDILFEVGKQHEDVFWSYQAIGRAERVSVIDYVGYHYRQRENSIMGRQYSLKNLDALEAYCRRYEYFKEYFPDLAQEGLTSIWTACIYCGQMSLINLEGEDRAAAFEIIQKTIGQYPIKAKDYSTLKFSHRCWLQMARFSLPAACRIKNWLNVGL